jgi:hypothetical protein
MKPEMYRYELFKGFSIQNVESRLGEKPFNLGNSNNFPARQETGSSSTGNRSLRVTSLILSA